jgi:hypothetical protein
MAEFDNNLTGALFMNGKDGNESRPRHLRAGARARRLLRSIAKQIRERV